MDKAFTYARAADPDSLLFYNDYNVLATFGDPKRDKILTELQRMIDASVPIDGMGLQAHLNPS